VNPDRLVDLMLDLVADLEVLSVELVATIHHERDRS
jgi:hypothetical protein